MGPAYVEMARAAIAETEAATEATVEPIATIGIAVVAASVSTWMAATPMTAMATEIADIYVAKLSALVALTGGRAIRIASTKLNW